MDIEIADGMMDQLLDSSVTIAYSSSFWFPAYGSWVLIEQHLNEENVATDSARQISYLM